LLAPEYSLEVQARIPAALSVIYNFISIHNPRDQPISNSTSDAVRMYDNVDEDIPFVGAEPDNRHGDMDLRWDMITQNMWDDYLRVCEERGIGTDDAIESDLEEDSDEGEESEDFSESSNKSMIE
jgi:hypothetical protein